MKLFCTLSVALMLVAAVNCSSASSRDEEEHQSNDEVTHSSFEDDEAQEVTPIHPISSFSLLQYTASWLSSLWNHVYGSPSPNIQNPTPLSVENNTPVTQTSIPSDIDVIPQKEERPLFPMPIGFKVKSLQQMCREANFKSTVVVDSLLIYAMRKKSEAAKAYAIGSIMFTFFRQGMGNTYNFPNAKVLDEVFLKYLFELPDYLQKMIERYSEVSEMTIDDVNSFANFIEKNYLKKPHGGCLFSLAAEKGAPIDEIYTTISLAVFTIKLVSVGITRRWDSWYAKSQDTPDAYFRRMRIGLSLLTIKEIAPFIENDIRTFILEHNRMKCRDATFIVFCNYLKEDVFKQPFSHIDLSDDKNWQLFGYIHLAMRKCPLSENKFRSIFPFFRLDDFLALEEKLVAAGAFLPVSLRKPLDFHYEDVEVRPHSTSHFEYEDYLLIVPDDDHDFSILEEESKWSLLEEMSKCGLLEYFALANGWTLLKRAQQ